MNLQLISGQARITNGTLSVSAIERSELAQEDLAVFPVDIGSARVHDAVQTLLPNPSANDDMGMYGGAFGTGVPYIATSDLKNAGATTRYFRIPIIVPIEYVAGETFKVRFSAGMITTVASASATVDMEAYLSARNSLKSGSDLCATAAQSINSTTFADYDFEITNTTLAPGDVLDVKVAVAVNDSATGTAVIGAIGAIDRVCDIKG